MSKKSDLSLKQFTVPRFQVDSMLSKSLKDLTCIFNVFLKGGTEYDNVIQVRYINSIHVSQTVFHKTLEYFSCPGKAKWHPNAFVKAPWSRRRLAVWTHESLMTGFPLIKDRKPRVPNEVVQHFMYSGYRVTVRSLTTTPGKIPQECLGDDRDLSPCVP